MITLISTVQNEEELLSCTASKKRSTMYNNIVHVPNVETLLKPPWKVPKGNTAQTPTESAEGKHYSDLTARIVPKGSPNFTTAEKIPVFYRLEVLLKQGDRAAESDYIIYLKFIWMNYLINPSLKNKNLCIPHRFSSIAYKKQFTNR